MQGKFEQFKAESQMSIEMIAERVVANREKYKAKFASKKEAQEKYYQKEHEFVKEI